MLATGLTLRTNKDSVSHHACVVRGGHEGVDAAAAAAPAAAADVVPGEGRGEARGAAGLPQRLQAERVGAAQVQPLHQRLAQVRGTHCRKITRHNCTVFGL